MSPGKIRFFTHLVNDFQCQQWIKVIVSHHQSAQTIGDQLLHFRYLPTDLFPQELKFLQLLSVEEFSHRINFRGSLSSIIFIFLFTNVFLTESRKKLYNSVVTSGFWMKISRSAFDLNK